MTRSLDALLRRLTRGAAGLVAMATLALCGLSPEAAKAEPRGGYIVVDMQTGAILDAYRSQTSLRPASLTKMMTLYLTFEALESGRLRWDQTLVVSGHAASMTGQRLYLRRGERITVGEAIFATAIYSANDAAVVLAEAVGGSEHQFTRLMNDKARLIGMSDTTFATASGLYGPEQFTTPRDMAVLARRLYFDFPDRYEIFGRTSFRFRGRRRGSTNGILSRRGVDGMKTGFTSRAGYNLAASAERDGRRVLVVFMGGPSSRERNNAVLALLDDGFERLQRLEASGRLLAGDRITNRPSGAPLQAPPPTLRASVLPPATDPRFAASSGAFATARIETGRIETGQIADADAEALAASVAESLAARASSSAGGGRFWSVQIGAFRDPGRASDLLRAVLSAHGREAAGAYQSVVPIEQALDGRRITLHRARLTNMDRASADALCAKLQLEGAPCLVVPPAGWTN